MIGRQADCRIKCHGDLNLLPHDWSFAASELIRTRVDAVNDRVEHGKISVYQNGVEHQRSVRAVAGSFVNFNVGGRVYPRWHIARGRILRVDRKHMINLYFYSGDA